MMDNLIRFVNSNKNTINTLRHTLKEHGYTWSSGVDLEDCEPPNIDRKKINLIIDPKTKKVYCDPESDLDSYGKHFYKIKIIDYNPPWY